MGKKTSTFDYKTLASFILPKGILDFFEVTDIQSKDKVKKLEASPDETEVHIYLDELDNRSDKQQDLRAHGFTEYRTVLDFPIRDHAVILHVRRRRWLDKDGHNKVLDVYSLIADGTSYSKEFADALKKIFGYVPDTGSLAGAVLQD